MSPGVERRVERGPAFALLLVREGDQQDAVRRRHADAHDRAHQARHAERRVRHRKSIQTMPTNAPGKRRDDDERVEPAWKFTTISR